MERTEDMVVTQLDKAKQEWKAEGQAEASIKMAKRMLAKGKYALEEIAEVTELPLEKVKELAESLSA